METRTETFSKTAKEAQTREGTMPQADSSQSSFSIQSQEDKWGVKLWTLCFDVPGAKVNTLNEKTMKEFEQAIIRLETLGKEKKIDVLAVVSGKKQQFIAGADLKMIQSMTTKQQAQELSSGGHKLMNRFEDLPFPVVAVVDGPALGGGCEITLGCRAIVMSSRKNAKIGLPEVLIGVLPGLGGCVRLPQKVGIATALDMILAGKQLNGKRALKAGLIEACLPEEDFENYALKWIVQNLKKLKSNQRLAKEPKLGGAGGTMGSALEKTFLGRNLMFKKAREGVMKKTKGQYPAPLKAIDVIANTGVTYQAGLRGAARDKALAIEAKGFGELASTDICKSLINLFYLTEGVKKQNGLAPGKTADVQKVTHGAVLGAGVMGGGIAQLFADKNISTRMKDLNLPALELGVKSASKVFKSKVKRRRMTKREYAQKMNLIAPVVDFSGFSKAQVVVEAIIENMDIKKTVLKELETKVSDNCVIATNTSSLSVSKMQDVLTRPENFVGMHFFNPVHKMPLVEVIRGEKSSDQAVAATFAFCKQLGKTPVVVKDAPGFLVNRLLMLYLNEACFLLKQGVPIDELDKALLKFGMPMGPMELVDEVGVDVADKVAKILEDGFGERMGACDLNGKIVASNRLGKKNGKGLYAYDPANPRSKEIDSAIYTVLDVKPQPGKVSYNEIIERCMLPMINEAARCLDEQVCATSADLDLAMIMGTGFPPFRGGLLRYADSLGLDHLVNRLKHYQDKLGGAAKVRFEPASALLNRASNQQRFYSE